jgi:hypothetical protein
MDIKKFQMKRINPFQGLVIDADTWQDAHNYHRDQQRLHVLAFHDTGIVSGLEVTANNPPDLAVNISAGIAIDQDGNVIIIPQKQSYRLQSSGEKGIIFLIVQFSEIPGEPLQPPAGGQPTRIVEAYRIQERERLPAESYVELARIEYEPSKPMIKDAIDLAKPVFNEIDLRYRKNAKQVPAQYKETVYVPPPPPSIAGETISRETLIIGHLAMGETAKDQHIAGLRNVIKELNRRVNYAVVLEDQVNLYKPLNRFSLLYMTGNNRFELNPDQQSALSNYLQSGGLIFGEGCSRLSAGTEVKGSREFGLAFNRFASRANFKLEIVKRGHPLLQFDHIFSETPPGCEQPMLLEGGPMICSNSDYGCAWEGGREDQPLSREIIRDAIELGCNILAYALRKKTISP